MLDDRRQGKFITFEGIECVGKSTQLERTASWLRSQGLSVVETREPGGTTVGERIREILLDRNISHVHGDTELLLMFSARNQHLQEIVIPEVEKGSWVLCDRFTDATFAYQGGGRGIELKRIAFLEDFVQGSIRPDVTLLLDVPIKMAMDRMAARGAIDRFEAEGVEFFHRIQETYLERARAYRKRFRVVDASGDIDLVQRRIQEQLIELLP